jgi:hypothetical protein
LNRRTLRTQSSFSVPSVPSSSKILHLRQGQFRGARASRTPCLASRQTHSGPASPCARPIRRQIHGKEPAKMWVARRAPPRARRSRSPNPFSLVREAHCPRNIPRPGCFAMPSSALPARRSSQSEGGNVCRNCSAYVVRGP